LQKLTVFHQNVRISAEEAVLTTLQHKIVLKMRKNFSRSPKKGEVLKKNFLSSNCSTELVESNFDNFTRKISQKSENVQLKVQKKRRSFQKIFFYQWVRLNAEKLVLKTFLQNFAEGQKMFRSKSKRN